MKLVYVGDNGAVNAAGRVTYSNGIDTVTFVAGVATETPEWLASKLVNSNHFEVANEAPEVAGPAAEPKRRGRPPKVAHDAD